jgi:hypothetical protein
MVHRTLSESFTNGSAVLPFRRAEDNESRLLAQTHEPKTVTLSGAEAGIKLKGGQIW